MVLNHSHEETRPDNSLENTFPLCWLLLDDSYV